MNNKPAVTLIETLISLTIVGVALLALLPVVTLRHTSGTTNFGNEYWQEKTTVGGTNYICPYNIQNNAISIGQGNAAPIKSNIAGVPSSNFTIFNLGIENRDKFPLLALERLRWNVTEITDNVTFRPSPTYNIHLGKDCNQDGANIVCDDDLYFNFDSANPSQSSFILEQGATASPRLVQTSANTFEFNKTYNVAGSQNILNSNLATIRMNNDEYMHVSGPTVSGTSFTHIGIGKNAIRGFTQTRNMIAIANIDNGTTEDANSNEITLNTDLVIGAKYNATVPNTNNYNEPSHWVIHHYNNNPIADVHDSKFTINADVVEFPSITVNKVILPSDRRLKTILSEYKKGLKEINKVKPVEFTYKKDEKKEHHIGVIAQDLRKVFPEAVEINKTTGYLSVGTDPVFYGLLNAIKELNAKNQKLKKENDKLEAKIKELKSKKSKINRHAEARPKHRISGVSKTATTMRSFAKAQDDNINNTGVTKYVHG